MDTESGGAHTRAEDFNQQMLAKVRRRLTEQRGGFDNFVYPVRDLYWERDGWDARARAVLDEITGEHLARTREEIARGGSFRFDEEIGFHLTEERPFVTEERQALGA